MYINFTRGKAGKVVLQDVQSVYVFNLGSTREMPGNKSIKFQLVLYGR